MRSRKQELGVFGCKKDKLKNLCGGLINIFWLLSKIMSENIEMFDEGYVDMSVVRCKYGKSCISPSEVCSEVDSYK
ncbi:unnamed protein product, partial [marine sediment metagenome]